MKIKFMVLFILVGLMTTTTFAANIQEYSPTKVIVNTDTGAVVYAPTELDYMYALQKAQLDYEFAITQTKIAADAASQITNRSLKDIIFGKKCSKTGK